ncbi:MAG TPA: SCP2 sterol-binding domain-containing protein [Candidatus Dormibacteraeota bacterium]|nr:SCP2 sterol-binding domain-containing protein [Candidatus Dormibacteraeota bacterium]
MSQTIGAARHLAKHSAVLSPFDARWPALVPPGSDLEAGFQRISERLGAVPWRSVVHVQIREDARPVSWSLQIGPDGTTAHPGRMADPDLEVMTDADAWRQIVAGALSPLSAFGTGRMRVIGDVRAARRIASRMAAAGEA